jgi:hypothetical protein
LYDEVLGYDDILKPPANNDNNNYSNNDKYVVIVIAGRGDVYTRNNNNKESNVNIVKLLAIGNAPSTPDKQPTFASFSLMGSAKLIMTVMGLPGWLLHW